MKYEIDAVKSILNDDKTLDRATMKNIISEYIAEIEGLRVALYEAESASVVKPDYSETVL